jgi:hypothetical protein
MHRRLTATLAAITLLAGCGSDTEDHGGGEAEHSAERPGMTTPTVAEDEGGHGEIGGSHGEAARGPGATDSHDLDLELEPSSLQAGRTGEFAFRILGPDGEPVTEFEVEHTKRMHLIVVRRDFAGFVHDHPVVAADGTWSTTLDLDDPGAYRVFADFVVDGDKHTVGTDLFVPGTFDPQPLPRPATTADAGDGYEVEIHGELIAGQESELELTIRHGGEVVTDIPDYLGAKGHLVALRDGDLAYLHVHAEEDRLAFAADFPTAGSYRLFLQFEHGGEIRTASFTVDAQGGVR